ncbi:putative hydrolase of the HAD superfamily [Catenuloplanes nepalensis]|uniref:Hydrolase of the HAD superfamily n=1 Tax=Catenuloplanes nepalensis TaxID=587533 RepID=A0ABT9MPZ1_9ACTN|nr:HAD family phosphatase [Catenuloplanes nepalensis]MDP9793396.1 putative hydrolase of the HAD superfamily [Catenuloplanes nepalensis]
MELDLPPVVFDIGGVLTAAEGGVAPLSALLDIPRDRFAEPYWRHRSEYDRGMPATEYWRKVATDLGATWPDEEITRIDEFDARRWSELAPGRLELIATLQTAGVRTALLSNAPASMARVARESRWSAGFDHRFFSSDLGMIKPEPEIYAEVEKALGTDLVFFDDRPPNVAAARDRGWQAHIWTDVPAARTILGLD